MGVIGKLRGGVRSLKKAVRMAGWRLRWRISQAKLPPEGRIPPPAWKIGPQPTPQQVVARYDAPPGHIARPTLYGSAPTPEAMIELPAKTPDRRLALLGYRNVGMLGRRVFVSIEDGTILPYSLSSTLEREWRAYCAGIRTRPPALGTWVQRHSGPIFAADVRYDGFGHTLLEVIPALALLRDAPAGSRVATSTPLSRSMVVMGGVFGVAPEQWLQVNEPLVCDEIYLPEMPILLHRHIHPIGWEAFDRLKVLGRDADLSERPERIFLSRAHIKNRPLTNEAEIEALFERRGFAIVHPETMPIESQIALMRDARLIAGLAGTAMHLAAFAPPDAQVLMVTSPRRFTTIDIHLNPAPRRLGYVVGTAGTALPRYMDVAWSVNASEVEAAIREHFDL